MANATDVLTEVAAGLRGPLATSILDIIAERDAAEAARVEAVNALAEEQGREATEEASESAAAQDLRDAFGEVAGLFDEPDLPDVEPLPDTPAEPTPDVPAEPTPVEPPVEEPAAEEPAPSDPAVDEPVAPVEEPAVDEQPAAPADEPVAPAEEPAVDDGSGAIAPGEVSDSEAGATPTDVAPNPGAEAEQQ